MTLFRPCIDLHNGRVKQIVGATLRDGGPEPETNFVAEQDPAWFAELYRRDDCSGGHVIKLGPGNDGAARSALGAWPGGLQIGGGIDPENAVAWLEAGADKVIVTSWLFVEGELSMRRVERMAAAVGRERWVIDLSCRRVKEGYRVATDRWQTVTRTPVDEGTLSVLGEHCAEYLVHAADVEGRRGGIDPDLVRLLGESAPIPCTYAGGANHIRDLDTVERLSRGRVDLTFGSALDIFGGTQVAYIDCVRWNRSRQPS